MKNNNDKSSPQPAKKDVVKKVASGERASLGDAPLTPDKKMQAEKEQMKARTQEQEKRHETDKQQTSLGGKILTPEKKSERARAESRQSTSSERKNSSKDAAK